MNPIDQLILSSNFDRKVQHREDGGYTTYRTGWRLEAIVIDHPANLGQQPTMWIDGDHYRMNKKGGWRRCQRRDCSRQCPRPQSEPEVANA